MGRWTGALVVLLVPLLLLLAGACASASDLETVQQKLATAEQSLVATSAALTRTQQDLATAQGDLSLARQDLASQAQRLTTLEGQVKASDAATKTTLDGVKSSLATAQADLAAAKTGLAAAQGSLRATQERAEEVARLAAIADVYEHFWRVNSDFQAAAILQTIDSLAVRTGDSGFISTWNALKVVLNAFLAGAFPSSQEFFQTLAPVEDAFLAALEDRLLRALDDLAAAQ